MTSGLLTISCLLTFALLSPFCVASGSQQESISLSHAPPGSPQSVREFPVAVSVVSNIGRPGVLLYNLESKGVINLKYFVNCSTNDDMYSVVATTSAKNIAVITNEVSFNISCANASSKNGNWSEDNATDANETVTSQKELQIIDNPIYIGDVQGEVKLTVNANMIGRSFLILLARKITPLETSKFNADKERHENSASFQPNEVTSSFQTLNVTGNISHGYTNFKGDSPPNLSVYGMAPNIVGKAIIIVMQLPRLTDHIFRIVLYVVIILATIGMGVKVDFAVIKKVLRRPAGPVIGLCCQYICMPLIAYMVAKVVPQESPAISLGIFACGIVPGGGPSNMFTYLLDGDLSLSVTMTTISSVAALGLLPLWLFTLGDNFKDDTVTMHVPYEKILEALAVAILPLFVGMFIKYKSPRISAKISKVLKPVLIIIVVTTLSFGVYTNFYIFKMISVKTILAGCMLPYVGYFVGGFTAFLCCRSWSHIKTIAIETGIQNTGIAFLILFLSLPPPDNQLASVAPASSVVMTPLPLFVAVFVYTLYKRCTRRHKVQETKYQDTILEKGNMQNEKSQVGFKDSPQQEDIALIILLWHKCKGTQPNRQESNEMAAKELATMLSDKEKIALS